MRISTRHERLVRARPERIAPLIADFDRVWPKQIAPAPRRLDDGLYAAGVMVWEPAGRAGAARAFRVVRPDELSAEHWFELEPADGGTVVRHIVEGRAAGRYEAIWRERIQPLHDRILEALFDNLEAALATGTRLARPPAVLEPGEVSCEPIDTASHTNGPPPTRTLPSRDWKTALPAPCCSCSERTTSGDAAARAFRVVRPGELPAEHWFELEPADGGTVVRHIVEGCWQPLQITSA